MAEPVKTSPTYEEEEDVKRPHRVDQDSIGEQEERAAVNGRRKSSRASFAKIRALNGCCWQLQCW